MHGLRSINMATDVGSIFSKWVIDSSDITKSTKAVKGLGDQANNADKSGGGLLSTFSNFGNIVTGINQGIQLIQGFGRAVAAAAKDGLEFQSAFAGAMAQLDPQQIQQFQQPLRDLAIQLGQDTAYSATEAAIAMQELLKAGISVEDIMSGALSASLSLAAAGELNLGDAASFAANAMNQFGLEGKDVKLIADQLAGSAVATTADVSDMGQALNQVGAVAATLKVPFEDTNTALALLAQNGVKGSDAGTSLKTALLRLNPTTDEAADEMKRLGLEVFDAQGNLKPFRDIVGQLNEKFSNLTDEQSLASQAIIFGQDAIRASSILVKEGVAGWDEMAKAIASVDADDIASAKLNSLSGDLQILQGSTGTMRVELLDVFTPALRGATQWITEAVNKVTTWIGVNKAWLQSNISQAVEWLTVKVQEAIAWIQESVKEYGGWDVVINDLKESLLTFIGSLKLLSEGLGIVLRIGKDLYAYMSENLTNLFEVIIVIWSGNTDAIIEMFIRLKDRTVQLFNDFMWAILNPIDAVTNAMSAFGEKIHGWFGASTWIDDFETLHFESKRIFEMWANAVTSQVGRVRIEFDEFGTVIGAFREHTVSYTGAMVESIRKMVNESDKGVDALKGIWTPWLEFSADVLDRSTINFEATRARIASTMTGISIESKRAIQALKDLQKEALTDWLVNFIEKYNDGTAKWANNTRDILKSFENNYINVFTAMRLVMAEAVGNSWYTDGLEKMTYVTGLWSGSMTSKMRQVKDSALDAFNAIRETMEEAVGNSWFTDLSAKMIDTAEQLSNAVTGSMVAVIGPTSGPDANLPGGDILTPEDIAEISNMPSNLVDGSFDARPTLPQPQPSSASSPINVTVVETDVTPRRITEAVGRAVDIMMLRQRIEGVY